MNLVRCAHSLGRLGNGMAPFEQTDAFGGGLLKNENFYTFDHGRRR